MSLMDEAMRMNAESMLNLGAARSTVAASSPAGVASNPLPATGQMTGVVRQAHEIALRLVREALVVARCGKCGKSYTRASFMLLAPVGWFGREQGLEWETLELRNCECHSTISRLVRR